MRLSRKRPPLFSELLSLHQIFHPPKSSRPASYHPLSGRFCCNTAFPSSPFKAFIRKFFPPSPFQFKGHPLLWCVTTFFFLRLLNDHRGRGSFPCSISMPFPLQRWEERLGLLRKCPPAVFQQRGFLSGRPPAFLRNGLRRENLSPLRR